MGAGFLYLVERFDGKEVVVAESRHEAVGYITDFQEGDWYDVVPISPLALLEWSPRMTSEGYGPHPGYPTTDPNRTEEVL